MDMFSISVSSFEAEFAVKTWLCVVEAGKESIKILQRPHEAPN
jgi:hypothetical protein